MELDPVDRRLLVIMQDDAARPVDDLAREVGLSASAVQRRLVRLRKAGVIERTCAVVDPESVGMRFTVLVEVQIDSDKPQILDAFRRWVKSEPAIQNCWYVMGEADYVLVVTVRDLDEYNLFASRMMAECQGARKFKSAVAMQTVKRSLTLDIG